MQRRRDTMWAAATSVPSVSSVPGSHAACICSKSCRSSLWICRLEQVAERQQPLVKAGRRVCLETADHRPHGFVVRDQRIDLTLAVDEGQPGGRKHVRLVDLEMRPQVTLIECQQPQHLLRQVGRPIGARVGCAPCAPENQLLRHHQADVVISRQWYEALVPLLQVRSVQRRTVGGPPTVVNTPPVLGLAYTTGKRTSRRTSSSEMSAGQRNEPLDQR